MTPAMCEDVVRRFATIRSAGSRGGLPLNCMNRPAGCLHRDIKMYADREAILALAEKVLDTKAKGKEDWCIHWLEWLWQQEIEAAIYNVKQGKH